MSSSVGLTYGRGGAGACITSRIGLSGWLYPEFVCAARTAEKTTVNERLTNTDVRIDLAKNMDESKVPIDLGVYIRLRCRRKKGSRARTVRGSLSSELEKRSRTSTGTLLSLGSRCCEDQVPSRARLNPAFPGSLPEALHPPGRRNKERSRHGGCTPGDR